MSKPSASFAIAMYSKRRLQRKRPGDHAYYKHPVLLLPSGPDKVWALQSHESESLLRIARSAATRCKMNDALGEI